MNTMLGVLKVAAKRIGIPFAEYMAKRESGLKWCTLGKHWQPLSVFYRNPARSDGLATSCRRCMSSVDKGTPLLSEKQERLAQGLKWCSGCREWLPSEQVPQSRCRSCLNQYARERYATNKRFRQERRQHTHSRKRNTEPIPPEVQDAALATTNGRCKYCGMPASGFDHIIPVSKGGDAGPDNIVPACTSCNSSKKDRNLDEWLASKN